MTPILKLFILTHILFFQCSSQSINQKKLVVEKVTILYSLPSYDKIEEIELAIDSTSVYYYDKYLVYELPLVMATILQDKIRADSTVAYYVGYDTTTKYAYRADSLHTPFKEVKLDSFLKQRPLPVSFSTVFKGQKINKEVQLESGKKVQFYTFKDPGIDSISLYFDDSSINLPFSYSKELDADNKSKLVKIIIKLRDDTTKNAVYLNAFRKITWELRPGKPTHSEEAIKAFCMRIDAANQKKLPTSKID